MFQNDRGRGRRGRGGGRGRNRRSGGQGHPERNGQNGYRNGIPNVEPSEEMRPIGFNNLADKSEELDGNDLAKFCLSHRGFSVLVQVNI